jgi:hypothetical protein
MALSKTVLSAYGFQAINAYHRVEAVSLIGKETLNFHVRIYVAADKPFFAEQVLSCAYALEGENPIKQAYAHLKTLPEFAGATDC